MTVGAQHELLAKLLFKGEVSVHYCLDMLFAITPTNKDPTEVLASTIEATLFVLLRWHLSDLHHKSKQLQISSLGLGV